MCQTCQLKKLADVLNEYGHRRFLHPYYDVIDFEILYMEIAPPFSSPTEFKLQINKSIDPSFSSLVERHIMGLDLPKRFEQYCIEKYMHLLRLASESRNAPEEIRPALKLFQKMEEKKAINTWGAIFYRAICRNEPLLNYLECGTLPANL
jgi:hypothetical protein